MKKIRCGHDTLHAVGTLTDQTCRAARGPQVDVNEHIRMISEGYSCLPIDE